MEIIPAIDIINGKCVRLTQGDFSQQKIYNENPLVVAKEFEAIGIKRLHLVDLDGANQGKVVNYKVLEKIASSTNLVIDFGGGIKTNNDIETVFDYGAKLAAVGSVAVADKNLFINWVKKYGSDKIFLGVDVKEEVVMINGWQKTTNTSMFNFIEENILGGVQQFFCTDISKDGLLQGPAIKLYEKTINKLPNIQLIASGGISSINDLYELKKVGCAGAIIGKAIYEKTITLNNLKQLI